MNDTEHSDLSYDDLTQKLAAFDGSLSCGPSIRFPVRLKRALHAYGLSDAATGTLLLLWEYVALSIRNGFVNDAGEVRIFPSKERLAERRDLSARSVIDHLNTLEGCGAIRRTVEGRVKASDIWVRALPHVLALLEQHEHVQVALAELEREGQRQAVVSEAEYYSANSQVDDSIEHMRLLTGKSLLMATMETSRAKTEAAHAQRAAKPDSAKMGKGFKARPKEPGVRETPHDLLEMLRNCVRDDMGLLTLPKSTMENLAKMKKLIDAYDYATARRVIEWVTTGNNWSMVMSKLRVDTPYPTPGVLLGYSERLVPLALGMTAGPRRSGGAREIDLSQHGVISEDGEF